MLTRSKYFVAVLIGAVIGSLGMLLIFNDSGNIDFGSDVEDQLREVIFIPDGEEPISTTLFETQDQINAVRSGNPAILPEAQVGDHYIVFPSRAILFRSEENRIYDFAPVQRPDS